MTESLRRTPLKKIGKVLAVNPDPEVINILEVNLAHANLEVISAQSGEEALKKVHKEKPDIILLDPVLPDIDGIELCQQLKEAESTHQIPVILIGAKNLSKDKIVKAVNGADYYVTKPFDPKEVVDLVLAHLKQKERAENLNPLTGLPNEVQVNNEITRLIEQKKTFAVIHIAMDDLRAFNKVYGYAQGDRTIQLLADIMREAARLFGNPDDLAGHLGGDKFVVVSTPWKARVLCRRIIADFNRRIKALYADEHLQKGYVAYESPSGMEEQSPIMSLRFAVVTNQERTFYHHLEVSEAAAEQMNYQRRFPAGKSYFDLQASGFKPDLAVPYEGVSNIHQEEVKAMHGVLAWLDFLIKELNIPTASMKNCLNSMENIRVENLSFEQQNSLEIIRQNITRLNRVVDGLTHLTRAEWLTAGSVFEEVHIGNTMDWIMEQLRDLAEQRSIEVDIEGAQDISRLLMNRRNLTQGLLYIIEGEILSSSPGSQVHVRVAEKNGESIIIQITNPTHHISRQSLAMLLKGQQNGVQEALKNELYPAKLLLEDLGGKLSVSSEKGKGVTYMITIPKRWQSCLQEANTLRLAVDISRKEARAELRNINHQLSSTLEPVPQITKDSMEKLKGKVQELGVLCNRSLFMADDINSRLETQQDRLLHQEAEQMATSEAMLTICREIAKSMRMEHIFDLDSAKRVAKYVLAIAKEFRLSESDLQALHNAALLKDLGLVLSPSDMVEQRVVTTMDEATTIRARFKLLWKALSTIPFLSQALVFVLYEYERYNGMSGSLGVRGDSIPLGARILAIADTFDFMTSGRSSHGILSPRTAVQKIVDDSGMRFDPHVVSAFLMTWKRKELVSPEKLPLS